VRIIAKLPNGTEIIREASAPAHFLIHAEVHHEIVALEDDTEYWCVFSHRKPDGEVIAAYDGWARLTNDHCRHSFDWEHEHPDHDGLHGSGSLAAWAAAAPADFTVTRTNTLALARPPHPLCLTHRRQRPIVSIIA